MGWNAFLLSDWMAGMSSRLNARMSLMLHSRRLAISKWYQPEEYGYLAFCTQPEQGQHIANIKDRRRFEFQVSGFNFQVEKQQSTATPARWARDGPTATAKPIVETPFAPHPFVLYLPFK